MIHEMTIKWHDLMEDPADLPRYNGLYWVVVMNATTKEILCNAYCNEYRMQFLSDIDLWYYQDWDQGNDELYRTYGTQVNIADYNNRPFVQDCYRDEFVVVAWAEDPEYYKPDTKNTTPSMESNTERSDQN